MPIRDYPVAHWHREPCDICEARKARDESYPHPDDEPDLWTFLAVVGFFALLMLAAGLIDEWIN